MNIKTNEPLVLEILALVKKSPLSQCEIAGKTGIASHTLYHWARGRRPRVDMLQAVANVLGYELVLRRKSND